MQRIYDEPHKLKIKKYKIICNKKKRENVCAAEAVLASLAGGQHNVEAKVELPRHVQRDLLVGRADVAPPHLRQQLAHFLLDGLRRQDDNFLLQSRRRPNLRGFVL